MKPSSRTEQGRSLIPMCQLKSDYLEYRVRQYKRFGINISHANITTMDFGLTVNQFMELIDTTHTGWFDLEIRRYVYKMRGKYGNNRMV